MVSRFKAPKAPYQIRAYQLAQRLLSAAGEEFSTEGKHILRKLKPGADRAQAKLDRPPRDPKKDEWDKAFDACWDSFSQYIRTRDTAPVGETRRGKCVTCENWFDFKELQAGHWIPTANWGTKLHPWNVHAQCWPCNDKMRGNGRMPLHEAAIRVRHGETAPEMLKRLVKTHARRLTADELWKKREEFDHKREAILAREAAGERPE